MHIFESPAQKSPAIKKGLQQKKMSIQIFSQTTELPLLTNRDKGSHYT